MKRSVPRKNAKSTLTSGIGLYLLTEDAEEGAEVYSAATTRDQARIDIEVARLFDDLVEMRFHAGGAIPIEYADDKQGVLHGGLLTSAGIV